MEVITQTDEPRKARFPILWRWTKALVLLFVFLVVLVIIASVALDIYGSRKLSKARAAAAAAGIQLTQDALLGTLPKVDETANAANYYDAAFALIRAKGFWSDPPTVPIVSRSRTWLPGTPQSEADRIANDLKKVTEDPSVAMPNYMLADAKAYLAERREVLDLVHEGAALPDARYHIQWQGLDTPLPHLTGVRSAARLASLAAWVDAEEKRPHEAVTRTRDIFALARSLANEPAAISSLVEMAVGIIGTAYFEHVVARCDVDNADLEALQKDIEDLANTFSVHLGMEGELATYCDFENSIIDGSLSPQESLAKLRSFSDDEKAPPAAHKTLGRFAGSLLKGYLKSDEAFAIKCYLDIIKEAEKPNPASLLRDGGSPAFADVDKSPFILARTLLPGLSQYVRKGELLRAHLRTTAAALAALRFKNDTGAWPEKLDTLVPKYLAQVPVDPFTGAPLIYALREGGIVVYSVGLNGVDDGGRGRELSIEKDSYDDAGFRVWR